MGWPAQLEVEEASLAESLKALRHTSGAPVAFSPSRLEGAGSVSCLCGELTVGQALERLLEGTPFEAVEVGGRILVEASGGAEPSVPGPTLGLETVRPAASLSGTGLPRTLPAPERRTGSITGTVTNQATGGPLAGAQVQIPGPDLGALTDGNGQYRIDGVPAGEVTVVVLMLGYSQAEETVTVGSGETVTLDVQLEERALGLDAIVVTGTPGEQQARSLGNVVGRLDASRLQELAPQPTLESMLSGSVAGMTVDFASGEVGSGSHIRIRGAGSIALSSQPLIYIDGVRANNEHAGQSGGTTGVDGRAPPSRLNDLSPEMIESVEVIKGPAAATLYGTEASNGVINIITRRGASGDPVFNLTTRVGQSWYPDPKKNWPSAYFTCQGIGTHDCEPGEVVGVNVFWEDYVRHGMDHFRVGMPRGVTGSISGGTDDLRYYFSLDADREEGPVPYNWENKTSGRANLNWTPRDDLTLDFGMGIIRSELSAATARQGPLTTGFQWACPNPGCEEGSGLPNALDGPFRGYIAYIPEVHAENVVGGQDLERNTFNLTATHEPFPWFQHRVIAGMDFNKTKNHLLVRHLRGGVGTNPRQGGKWTTFQTSEFLSLDYSATATVEPTDRLSLATSAGIQYYDRSRETLTSQGTEMAVPALETIASAELRSTSDEFLQNRTIGVYFQEALSWDNRLFLTGAVRGDDNSAFGADFDFVVYPKLSASWVVSEEAFLAGTDWLTQLRLRAAWGEAGQQPDIFAAQRLYEPVGAFEGRGGLTPRTIGNPEVEPEVGEELEIGFDAGVWDDRFNVEFTYYNQKRRNALLNVPVRPSTGFPGNQFQNVGEIVNTGVEIGLDWEAFRGRDVNVLLGANISTNSNEITDMGGLGPQRLAGSNPSTGWAGQRFVEGFPLAAIFQPRVVSAEVENLGTRDARAVSVMCESGPEAWPGENITRGGGEPVPCTSDDAPAVFRGSPIPTREVSVNATVTLFQDLQLYAQVDYAGGHKLIDGAVAAGHTFFQNTRAIHERDDPILLGYEALGAIGSNQPGLYDASFARLRRVSASYNLPDHWAQSFGASRATFTVTGQNLWLPWRAQEEGFGARILDPERRFGGTTSTDPGGLSAYHQDTFPATKRILATFRVTF